MWKKNEDYQCYKKHSDQNILKDSRNLLIKKIASNDWSNLVAETQNLASATTFSGIKTWPLNLCLGA